MRLLRKDEYLFLNISVLWFNQKSDEIKGINCNVSSFSSILNMSFLRGPWCQWDSQLLDMQSPSKSGHSDPVSFIFPICHAAYHMCPHLTIFVLFHVSPQFVVSSSLSNTFKYLFWDSFNVTFMSTSLIP
jgi:hypothetical protein